VVHARVGRTPPIAPAAWQRRRRAAQSLAPIAAKYRLAMVGAGATPRLANSLGADLLGGDPVSEAATLA
jgi:hypothetical protein